MSVFLNWWAVVCNQYDGNSYLGQQTENPQLVMVYTSWYSKTESGYTDTLFHNCSFYT